MVQFYRNYGGVSNFVQSMRVVRFPKKSGTEWCPQSPPPSRHSNAPSASEHNIFPSQGRRTPSTMSLVSEGAIWPLYAPAQQSIEWHEKTSRDAQHSFSRKKSVWWPFDESRHHKLSNKAILTPRTYKAATDASKHHKPNVSKARRIAFLVAILFYKPSSLRRGRGRR